MQLNRYSPPTKLDKAPKGSQCFVRIGDGEAIEVYMQTNEDEENPKWQQLS